MFFEPKSLSDRYRNRNVVPLLKSSQTTITLRDQKSGQADSKQVIESVRLG